VRRQLAAYQRNQRRGESEDREDYEFYDVTAWSLPLTLGLDAWWTDDSTPLTGGRVSLADSLLPPPAPGRAQSAYLFTDENDAHARLAMRLLREGFRVAFATRPLSAGGAAWPRGTFVVRVQRNPDSVHERIATIAREVGARVVAVQSAFPDSGQVGLGSESVVALHRPRVLLASGDGIEQTAFGSVWFYLEQELGIPVTPINLAALGRVNFADYNVLIIPNGYAGRLWRELGEGGATRLKAWVESGGEVIAFGGAVGLLARKELELTTVTALEADSSAARDTTLADAARPGPPLLSPSASAGSTPEVAPGAIFRATLDRSHWLTAGYDRDALPVYYDGASLLKPSEKGANPVVLTDPDLELAGFSFPGNTEKFLRNSVWAAVETVGDGHVVLFAENPVYRGFWRGPAKLLTNAILIGPGR